MKGVIVSASFRPHGLQPARLLCPWDSPGVNTGVGCRFLLQGIFLAQRLVSWLRGWSPGSEVGLLAQKLVSWLRGWSPGSEVGLLAQRLVSWLGGWSPVADLMRLLHCGRFLATESQERH